MATLTACLPVYGMCFDAIGRYLDHVLDWESRREDALQAELLSMIGTGRDLPVDLSGFMESFAAGEIEAVNQWLQDRGFTIQLTGQLPPGGFAVAAVLRLALSWKSAGVDTKIYANGNSYAGFRLARGYQIREWPEGIAASLETTSGFTVHLAMLEQGAVPRHEVELMRTVHALMQCLSGALVATSEFSAVEVPNVSIDLMPECGLVGVHAATTDAVIAQAVVQHRFRLDRDGAVVEAAAAMAVTRGGPTSLVFRDPFYAFVTDSAGRSVFAAYVDTDAWTQIENPW
jgi:hypothetical protein